MFKLTLRRCFFLTNFCVVIVLAVAVLSLFFLERWLAGERFTSLFFTDPMEEEYERQVLEDEARVVPGLGDGGKVAELYGDGRRGGKEYEKNYVINTYLSDRISYTRTLEDLRHPACARVEYDAELPSASVVIVFRDEPYSLLLRTVWSVLSAARRDQPWHERANFVEHETNRTMAIGYPGQGGDSEHVYLKEVLLVDDHSTLPELRGKLAHYVRTRLPRGLVRLLRLPERSGLTRARQAGARAARGDVLVVLDAHCEGLADWLRPLLQRVKDNRTAVVTPIIQWIDAKTFELHDNRELVHFAIFGFVFSGYAKWIYVPDHEWERRRYAISPTRDVSYTWRGGNVLASRLPGVSLEVFRSPTMSGGLFAMSRSYYWELGGYDEQMIGWGGENLEMSFRVWQCGGTLETIPCARVGHVYRTGRPSEQRHDTLGINMARVAEVWMDEYKELFYLHRPDARKNPRVGDVSARKALRERLHCRSFQWFLDTVYHQKFVPVRDAEAYGRVQNPLSGLCLDSTHRPYEENSWALGFRPCLPILNITQHFSLTHTGQFRDEVHCVQLQGLENNDGRPLVVLKECDTRLGGLQWQYLRASKQLRHARSGLCLDAHGAVADDDARAGACANRSSQRWTFDYDGSQSSTNLFPPGVEERIRKLPRRRTPPPDDGLMEWPFEVFL